MSRRLKSKMKKSDPTSYSIHDFLSECKSNDAADSRFEQGGDDDVKQELSFVNNGKGMNGLYAKVEEKIKTDYGWKKKKDDSGRFHMILGGMNGNGIPFKRFAQLFKWDYGIVPHCNYFRGHVWFSRKTKLIQIMRQYRDENDWEMDNCVPESYLYFPSTEEDNEVDELRIACESGSKREEKKVWILKCSDGTRGEKILLMDDFDKIVQHLESQDKASAPWVIQKYISNPLLLNGGRKFDIRFYVLIDHKLNAYVFPQGTIRVCSEKFTMDDLCEKFAHLSNRKLQGKHEKFGQSEENNEMTTEQFAKWFSSECGGSYDTQVFEKAKDIIQNVIRAGKNKLENVDHADYSAFQLFGFDFILDKSHKLWFHEINANPNVPDCLVDDIAEEIIELAIKPVFSATMGNPNEKKMSFQQLDDDEYGQNKNNNNSYKK